MLQLELDLRDVSYPHDREESELVRQALDELGSEERLTRYSVLYKCYIDFSFVDGLGPEVCPD